MESPAMAKKLWNLLRVAFFMMRKGLISKRKLLLDMNLVMKKGKFLTKTWGKNIAFHSHNIRHSKRVLADPIDGITMASDHYEFSCSNTPSPNFHHKALGSTSKRRHHVYFSCIGRLDEENDESAAEPPMSLPQIEYSEQDVDLSHLSSPFSVRVSNYSSDDFGEGIADRQVDVDATDFIRRFYEQLRGQCRIQLLDYKESENEDMLVGGSG